MEAVSVRVLRQLVGQHVAIVFQHAAGSCPFVLLLLLVKLADHGDAALLLVLYHSCYCYFCGHDMASSSSQQWMQQHHVQSVH